METSRKRIRRDYAPLNVAVSLSCISPGSLPTQVYNSALNEYEPDRIANPCVISPLVIIRASDNSWDTIYANRLLAEMKWMVNGRDITGLADWKGKYTIDNTDGPNRGAISIKRTVEPGTVYALKFVGVVADTRTGMNVPVETEEISLSTSDKSEDKYSISLNGSSHIEYNPFVDKLALYEYKVAHGLMTPSHTEQMAAEQSSNYKCRIPISVYKGKEEMNIGYTLSLFKVNSATNIKAVSSNDKEVIGFNDTSVELDLRLITKADYMIKAFVKNVCVAQIQFSVNRVYPKFRCEPTNETSIDSGDTERYDKAMVQSCGNIVECPESLIRIIWKTDTVALKNVVHNEGGSTLIDLAKTGIGHTYANDWLDVYTEAEHKEAYSVATDGNGDILVDENDNVLIFN